MIDLTPLEVRKKKGDFRKALRGYEPALVDDFLDIVADRLEQLVRENNAMTERITRVEAQIADYRDRERALTDALVTAQEMREEIREQTSREADLLRRTAQQEAETQVREATQQSERMVREATQTAEDRTRKAQQESERLVRTAQQEAERTLRVAEQQASQLRTDAIRAREHEEELMRRLRARQQQLLSSYRTFLERELGELNVITESLGLNRETLEPEPEPRAPAPAPAIETLAEVAIVEEVLIAPEPIPEPEPEPEPIPEPEPEPEPDPFAAFEEPVEPFEPEPVYDEDLPPMRTQPSDLLQRQPEVAEESGEANEAAWDVQLDLDEVIEDEDEEDAATAALLENAARAGYRFDLEDDEGPELLLEEPGEDEEDEERGDDDWLSTVIEDPKP